MDDEFGTAYAGTLARDHVLGALGGQTSQQALAAGEAPRAVWAALCDDFDVPESRRLGQPERPAPGLAESPSGSRVRG